MNHLVNRVSHRKFYLEWENVPESALSLDFNPIVDKFRLDSGCLLHWQARPKGLRRWGVYDIKADLYTSLNWSDLSINSMKSRVLEVNENEVKTVPTSVLYYPRSRFVNGVISRLNQ